VKIGSCPVIGARYASGPWPRNVVPCVALKRGRFTVKAQRIPKEESLSRVILQERMIVWMDWYR
jgi:hypothetical protein